MTVPKLISAESWVFHCAECGKFLDRIPKFIFDIQGDSCENCGCTSFITSEGRPYGRRSKDWKWIEETFLETWHLSDPESVEWVKTEPPLETLLDFHEYLPRIEDEENAPPRNWHSDDRIEDL